MLGSMLKNLRHRAAPPAPKAEAGLATPVPQTRFADRLTIVVPSVAGRLRFFDTALRHFATCGVRWPIVVSDHSTTEHEGVLGGAAARYPGLDLRVLRHPPGMHFLSGSRGARRRRAPITRCSTPMTTS